MSIKLENVVLAAPEQMMFVIQGLRNPMNSHARSDSYAGHENMGAGNEYFKLGENDRSLMQRLSNAGTEHRKYMRMMPVYVRITAPLYWWKEFDTYKIGTVSNSCSTMHKIAEREFALEDFSVEHLETIARFDDDNEPHQPYMLIKSVINCLNACRKTYLETKSKTDWWQMIQLLPSSYNQTRNVMLNYEVLANIYRQRKNHKLDEWREFCKWIDSLPYSELIAGPRIEPEQAVEDLFKPYEIDEETAEALIKARFPNIESAKDYIQARLAEEKVDNTRGTGFWQPGDED